MKTSIIITLSLAALHATAQSPKNKLAEKPYQAYIIIHQTGTDQQEVKQQLTLSFREISSTAHITFNSSDTAFKERASYRSFPVTIPAKRSGLRIDYTLNRKTSRAYAGLIRDYVIHAGDTIEMVLHKDSLHFLGKTAPLLNLQTKIFALERPELPNLPPEDPAYFKRIDSVFLAMLCEELKFIEQHRTNLSLQQYQYLRNQAIGYRHFMRIKFISGAAIKDEALGKRAMAYYLSNPVEVPIPKDNNLDQASNFIDFLYQKERMDYEARHPSLSFDRKGGEVILNNIAKKYSGNVRDRMLIVAFIHLSKSYLDVSDYFSKKEALIPPDSRYYAIYKKIKAGFDPQLPAYNFALQDTNGKTVRLSDFRGKVVLLDFWFTGCRPCLILKEAMVPVFAALKDKNDLVSVTISIDNDKQTWINSVRSQAYTHPGSFNLIAPGGKDQVIKQYNISAYPRLMVIDKKGKIASMKLPSPHTKEARATIVKTIAQAMIN